MKRAGLFAVVAGSAVMAVSCGGFALGAPPSPPNAAAAPRAPAEKPAIGESNKEPAAPDEAADARNAARTRMRECGHQWSSMKKSGASGAMTWKDFSQGCLARK